MRQWADCLKRGWIVQKKTFYHFYPPQWSKLNNCSPKANKWGMKQATAMSSKIHHYSHLESLVKSAKNLYTVILRQPFIAPTLWFAEKCEKMAQFFAQKWMDFIFFCIDPKILRVELKICKKPQEEVLGCVGFKESLIGALTKGYEPINWRKTE